MPPIVATCRKTFATLPPTIGQPMTEPVHQRPRHRRSALASPDQTGDAGAQSRMTKTTRRNERGPTLRSMLQQAAQAGLTVVEAIVAVDGGKISKTLKFGEANGET